MQDTGLERNSLGGESVLVVALASHPCPAPQPRTPFTNSRSTRESMFQYVANRGTNWAAWGELALQLADAGGAPLQRRTLLVVVQLA